MAIAEVGREEDEARAATRPAVEARVAQLADEAAALEARAGAERRLVELEAQLDAAAARWAAAEERASRFRIAWRSGLAGRLATHLADGQACPTCGATDHPDPARPADEAPSDDELEDVEKATPRTGRTAP